MELFHVDNPLEELLARKAERSFLPLGGTMELLPLCNMDCKMCYVKQSKQQMESQGRMLTCDEWLRIADDAQKNGVLYLLLTGGEPLLYPEFERLYTSLAHMGFVLSINTNATLINEKWANLFAKYPCRRINITLYGKDNETYSQLCNNPNGFTQVINAVELLHQRKINFRFTCSVTPYNMHQIPDLFKIAQKYNVPLEPCSYMFPPYRREDNTTTFIRLSPEQAAANYITTYIGKQNTGTLVEAAKNTLEKIGKQTDYSKLAGLTCKAARSGFWINWKGELLPCGMFKTPKMSLLEHSFKECWIHIVRETLKLKRCQDCENCNKREICKTCAAACLTETGSTEGKPEYLCQLTDELIRLSKEIIHNNTIASPSE